MKSLYTKSINSDNTSGQIQNEWILYNDFFLYATYREKASVTKIYEDFPKMFEQERKSQWASEVLQI